MEKLGDRWLNKLRDTQLSPHQLAEAMSLNEEPARAFLTDLRTRWLEDGILTAIKERSTEIIFDAPLCILGTRAFDEFLLWAREQRLRAMPSGVIFDEGTKKSCQIALRVTPLEVS
jgi:hypothetical protein